MVSLVALVPMLFHSIWGCCWHHEHPAVAGNVQVVADAHDAVRDTVCRTQARHSCCSSHGHHNQPAGVPAPEEHPSEDAPCEQERCDYSVTAQTLVPSSIQVEHCDDVCPLVNIPVPSQALLTAVRRSRDDLRPHLTEECRAFIQVWLI